MKLPAGYVPGEGVRKATAYGGFGERLLKRMGWEEGKGLGTNQHGMRKAIEVKKKEDHTGVHDHQVYLVSAHSPREGLSLSYSFSGWNTFQAAVTCVQVGGTASAAWEKKWWEEAYQSKLQQLQVHESGHFAAPRPCEATCSLCLSPPSFKLN